MTNSASKIKIYIPVIKFGKNRFKFFFDINYSIFPILWTTTFFIGILESFTYSGYSFRHLFLPFKLMFALTIFSGIISRLGANVGENENKNPTPNKIMFTINKLIIVPLVVSYLLVNSLELQNYPNYVFSMIHLQPSLYYWPMLLSVYLFILGIQLSRHETMVRRIFLINVDKFDLLKTCKVVLLRVMIFAFTLNIFMTNFPIITSWMYDRSKFMIKYPLASYDEKMRYGWGDFYDYMLFIRNNTPEDSVIMFPPMINPWMDVGGGGLIRYFLYPREIVQDMTDVNAQIDNRATYSMLAWGSGICTPEEGECHGWPRQNIAADYIVYKKSKSVDVEKTLYNVTYNYSDEINKGAWGIIKINKK